MGCYKSWHNPGGKHLFINVPQCVSAMVLWAVEMWARASIGIRIFFLYSVRVLWIVTTPSYRVGCLVFTLYVSGRSEKPKKKTTSRMVDPILYDTMSTDGCRLNHIQHHTMLESAVRLCNVKTICVGFFFHLRALGSLPLPLCNITAGQRWFIDLKLT